MLATTTTALEVNTGVDPFTAGLCTQWLAGSNSTFFSSYSIASALAMTAQGARGATANEIATALGYDSTATVATTYKRLNHNLTTLQSSNLVINIANGLFPQEQFKLQPDFLATVQDSFSGTLTPLDYIGATETARLTINNWVAQKTADMITELLTPGTLTPDTRLTLVNAIYFKGAWQTPFDPKLTHDAPFFSHPDAPVTVPMMQRRGELRYAALDHLSGVELPYAGGRLSLLLLLPAPDTTLATAAKSLTSGAIASWDEQRDNREVELFLPRFKLRWKAECGDALQQLGITNLFRAGQADLSGIAGAAGDLFVSDVIHEACIEVNEEGTEAAAATAAMIRLTALRPQLPPVTLRFDRPFLFLIRERPGGTILFSGALTEPR